MSAGNNSAVDAPPIQLTNRVLDISATEHIAFRNCRRRWFLEVIENLQSKQPSWAFSFGTGMHRALETLHDPRLSDATPARVRRAQRALSKWHDDTEAQAKADKVATPELLDELYELANLGHMMIENYAEFDETASLQLGEVLAIEGRFMTPGGKMPARLRPGTEAEWDYPRSAKVLLHPSGRLLVPIVDPDTHRPLEGRPMFSARIDLLTWRDSPYKGLCLIDHKTAAQAPSDRGIDFDDQVTGYSYVIWRWLHIIPRSVIYNVLIKQAPKEPRMTQSGLSAAKDQLTTPSMYREALKANGLMNGSGRVTSEKHAECLSGLLARGWDPFFRRYQPTRNRHELLDFERRLFTEYQDMAEARWDPEKRYPNFSTFNCPFCSVRPICQAMKDGSDWESVVATQYQQGEDRKA